ncbi:hypothetical protein GALMADRAFT_522291 [Galerina marginata CBS 339.88]|uniref:MYND-type domain-containing protein n=1 Tax=Galerina marginata (strain CBS 339.88) TaxID=685588 RepID=A0A067SVU3_GALM3|nr:hypothetical protein GALMADRAFT_522291 [Galerina marginata CBS 339.88]
MPDYAQIITHTPEQTLEWKEIARSNPGRVARTLVLPPEGTTREGDDRRDIYPALEAVREISMEGRNGGENKAWEALVAGGIANALCKNVCEMVVFFHVLPTMPSHLMEKVRNEIRSPYYAPLEILCNAAVNFQYPPTKTDKKVIAALRKNWSEMMERIWNEPEGTIRPEDSHTLERMVVAQLVMRIIITDPTFISVLYEPSDLSIQVIARHWKYAQRLADTALTASSLSVLLEPSHPRLIAYVRSNGLESSTAQLVSKIFVGVGPTKLSSKQQQAKALVASFSEHLVRLTGPSAGNELDFLMTIIAAAKNDACEPEVAKTILKATPLWNALFRLLKKSAKPVPANAEERASLDPESEKQQRLRVIANIVGTSANTLHNATFKHSKECEPLLRIWANENLFGALEETIDLLISLPGMTMQLTRLVSIIDTIVSEDKPALLRLYRTQFPRWRILGTLIRHDIKQQQATGLPPPAPTPGVIAPSDSNLWDHSVWQCFGSLQIKCMDRKVCGKRGCENENTGKFVCQCQAVEYCSETCQTKDTKEHRLACGLLGLLDNVGVGRSARHAAPTPAQPTKGKKKSPAEDLVSGGSDVRLEDLD